MIVQCDKCETKFRIADEKVTGSGVKVRCSKCAHVFVVRKDPGLGSPAGTPGLGFGEGSATTVKVAPDALSPFGSGSLSATSALNASRAPTLPAGSRGIPPPANTKQIAAALGFGAAPRIPIPAFSTNASEQKAGGLPAFPDSTKRELPTFPESSPNNDRFPEARPASEVKTEQMRLPGAKRDPFHDFAQSTSPPSGFFPPPPMPPTEPFPKIKSESSNPFAKLPSGTRDPFNDVGSDPERNPFLSADPFGAASPQDPFPMPSALLRPPESFSSPGLASPAARPESNPFQNPPLPGGPKSDPKTGFFPPPPADFGHAQPNVPNQEALDHDPFADIDIEAPSIFDAPLGGEGPSSPGALPTAKMFPEPLARIQFGGGYVPPQGEMSHAKTAVAAAYREEEEDGRGGWWPTVIGAAAGMLIALFVFPGLLGDWMDLRIGTELIQPKKMLPESMEQVTSTGARVTSYDGKNGVHMLVVSGSAHNDGKEKLDNVQAVVLMLSGDEIVERRRALVGVTLDESTLASVESAADLESAYRTAKQAATPEQLEIAPGANARFVVVFPETPNQIETRKFRVEFVKAPVESAKKIEPGQ